MPNPFRVRTLMLTSGERLPVLIDLRTDAREPLFGPTVFTLTQLRQRHLAAHTIELALRHIMVLLLVLEDEGIDLKARVLEGRLLDLPEIERITKACSLYVQDVVADGDRRQSESRSRRTGNVERLRVVLPGIPQRSVATTSAANRIARVAEYISWQVKGYLLKLPADCPGFLRLRLVLADVIEALMARAADGGSRSVIGAREGLSPEIASRVMAVTEAGSPENPWIDPFTKVRNQLLFQWFMWLGPRRGELLNVRIGDIDFRKEQFTIFRRADAKDDPRPDQPLVKTRDRILPLSPGLCQLSHDYVVNFRGKLRGAKTHDALFVAAVTGKPLSLSAVNKLFAHLRGRVPGLPNNLSPHVLRHTWNDRFSNEMDRSKTSEAEEERARSYLMGWSETSQTAAIYTRRHIREKAKKASLSMQEQMTKNI